MYEQATHLEDPVRRNLEADQHQADRNPPGHFPERVQASNPASTPNVRKPVAPITKSALHEAASGPAPRKVAEPHAPPMEASTIQKGKPIDVQVIIHAPHDAQGEHLPAFYADKARAGTHQLETRDPRLASRQRSFETISKPRTPFGSQEMLSHSFDQGARTPSPSQFQTKAPSPFGGRVQSKPLPQSEAPMNAIKRKFEHDACAPTQPPRIRLTEDQLPQIPASPDSVYFENGAKEEKNLLGKRFYKRRGKSER
ncbi:hypothetical protein ACJJTC_006944 [Scirpophaga incertulas]